MKLKIEAKIRVALITIVSLLTCLSCILMFWQIKYPGYKDVKSVLFRYTNSGGVGYKCYTTKNPLNNGEILYEGNTYITAFIDRVIAHFNYEFHGEKPSAINGDCEIIALMEGYDESDKVQKAVWKRSFVIVPRTKFSAKNNSIALDKTIPINIKSYNDFATRVIKDSGLGVTVRLSIMMNVNLNAKTQHGIVQDKASPKLIIPLNVKLFNITKGEEFNRPGSFEEVNKVSLPINRNNIIALGIVIGILLILIIYLAIFTTGYRKDQTLLKKVRKIFKDHGSRLVALNDDIKLEGRTQNNVRTIDDLVKVADEVCKPIFYKHNNDQSTIVQFYVMDGNELYLFNLLDFLELTKNNKQAISTEVVNESIS